LKKKKADKEVNFYERQTKKVKKKGSSLKSFSLIMMVQYLLKDEGEDIMLVIDASTNLRNQNYLFFFKHQD
jgi:hypothetical protein